MQKNELDKLIEEVIRMFCEKNVPILLFTEANGGLATASTMDIETEIPFILASYLVGLGSLEDKEILVNSIKAMNETFEALGSPLKLTVQVNM